VAARLLHTPPPLTHALPQENLGKQGVCNGFIPSSFSRRRWPANKKKHKQSSGSFSFFQMCFLIFFFRYVSLQIFLWFTSPSPSLRVAGVWPKGCWRLGILHVGADGWGHARFCQVKESEREYRLVEGWAAASVGVLLEKGRPIWVCGRRRARAASVGGDGGLWAEGGNGCWAERLSCGGLVCQGKRMDLVRRDVNPV